MKLTYKRATHEDIDTLTKTRIEVLRAANQLSNDIDMSEVERKTYNYYQKAFCDGSHIAYLAFDETRFVGAGARSTRQGKRFCADMIIISIHRNVSSILQIQRLRYHI